MSECPRCESPFHGLPCPREVVPARQLRSPEACENYAAALMGVVAELDCDDCAQFVAGRAIQWEQEAARGRASSPARVEATEPAPQYQLTSLGRLLTSTDEPHRAEATAPDDGEAPVIRTAPPTPAEQRETVVAEWLWGRDNERFGGPWMELPPARHREYIEDARDLLDREEFAALSSPARVEATAPDDGERLPRTCVSCAEGDHGDCMVSSPTFYCPCQHVPSPSPRARELVAQLTALRAAASPGPWDVSTDDCGGTDLVGADETYVVDELGALSAADAALIVWLVNHTDELLAALGGDGRG